jgi:aspartyl-tRNA(Asn)/glutamyl-tRNA(Gln) amidotransferase subunit A
MSGTDLAFSAIAQLSGELRRKRISPVELVRTLLARIETFDPQLRAYVTVTGELALEQARRAEAEIQRGRWRGPLHGIPLALKDNIETRGVRTTAGAKFLSDFVPQRHAAVVERLQRSGAVLLGKTNLHEFAYGVTTENPHYGTTHNPWNLQRMAGGSSGGAAAAVAAGLAFGALGSDTGGSIRIPAALCGVTGLKPTFGRVSGFGVVPLSPSLDHVGPLARSAEDAAILLGAIAGWDRRDPVSVRRPVPDFRAALRRRKPGHKPLRGIRLGRPREYFFDRVSTEVLARIEAALREFEQLGAEMVEVSLPHVHLAADAGTTIALAEATQYHRQAGYFPAHAGEYSEEVRQRLELGGEVRAVDYLAARATQKELQKEFAAVFERVTAVVAPSAPVVAPLIGEKMISVEGAQESVRSALLRFNRPSNLTGCPALSIPCGLAGGLPVGLQLIGRWWDEGPLCYLAACYQQVTGYHLQRPTVS